MTRLTALAAALAAGLTSFAAHSQEAPINPADAFTSEQKAEAAEKKTEKEAEPAAQSAHEGRGMMHQMPGVDMTTTASTSEKPDLEANARKKAALEKVTEKKAVATGGSYDGLVAKYAAAHGVPVALAHAVIRIESNYRPGATGRAGEVGLMQIKPSTARGLGYTGSVKALYDPATNLQWGMKYLGMAHKLGGGDTCGTILRYNAGHAAKRMNPISAAYCAKVKQHMS
ncbi:MAG: transglycosylase SLT domain-containing protein [Rhizobiaceae bacterium]|nr:transglycosylase SLT domain-containing protein [Rhizobiaceae bacterium]MCV0406534.1 transglycosylase SLT domain-containing protein [Rhizobiaceae bacterium]